MLPFPPDLDLRPTSRWPTCLPDATRAAVMAAETPAFCSTRFSGWHEEPSEGGTTKRAASVVIVTHNNLLFTKLCLHSLLAHTEDVDYEVIVVDNGSDDGTLEYLQAVERLWCPRVRLALNPTNRGFAPACNQGLGMAAGESLVLLNNDTIVPPGWLPGLLDRLRDPAVGLVGPVTNRSGNEAQIVTAYRTYGALLDFAKEYRRAHYGESFDIRMLAMFCTAMRHDVFAHVGPLDEQFEIGLFEDDDYAMRVRQAGYRVLCAEDVYVHHFGQASIGKLAGAGRYGTLFHANRSRWEAKWKMPWEPYRFRPRKPYEELIERIREVVAATLPPGSRILVVSKGDDGLLDLCGHQGQHFPQGDDGGYAGYNPARGEDAIGQLEALRAAGAQYLLFPETALWWLDYYADLRSHLEANYRVAARRDGTCLIFSLQRNIINILDQSVQAVRLEAE